MNMHNNINNSPSFGTLVPRKALLRTALRINSFEDAKEINQKLGVNYAGHIGFHVRATRIADSVYKKDKEFRQTVDRLKDLPQKDCLREINSITSKMGENIDISV